VATTIDAKLASRLRATEPGIFDAIKKRGEERRRATDWFIVPDEDGNPLYAFMLHNLWHDEYERTRKKHSPPIRDEASGVEVPGPVNLSAYQAELIHMATEDVDRKALWDNPDQRNAYGVQSNIQVIERMLGGPGIKAQVIAAIDRLGKYGAPELTQADLEKLLGNSSAPEGEPQSSTESGSETESSPGPSLEPSG
jgi:hypothetical protein